MQISSMGCMDFFLEWPNLWCTVTVIQPKIVIACRCGHFYYISLLNTIHPFVNYVTTLFLAWEPRFHESWANRLSSWCMTASLPGQKEDSDVITERVYCSMVWHRNIYCVCFHLFNTVQYFLYLCNCISIELPFFMCISVQYTGKTKFCFSLVVSKKAM